MDIHPDDILVFKEVCDAMFRVAKVYSLPLKSISGMKMPLSGMSDRLGDCSYDGNIRLVLRCTVNGEWCETPCSPDQIWETAAHELAHLRHFDHSPAFLDFCEELQVAMNNKKKDHKQKVIDRLIKMQAVRQGEADLGNEEAAEAFAAAINRMMIDYELSPSDLDYARALDDDPVVEVPVQLGIYSIPRMKTRIAWQESLAQMVAKAHLCKILVRGTSNDIWFVGTRSHAMVAEYVYGTVVPAVATMSKKAETAYWKATGCGRGKDNKALGYRAAWISAFLARIRERFEEGRKAAVAECPSESTALLRLDGAMIKVQKYIDDKFSERAARRHIVGITHRSRDHADGMAHGRAAADKITLGRRGLTTNTTEKKRLT